MPDLKPLDRCLEVVIEDVTPLAFCQVIRGGKPLAKEGDALADLSLDERRSIRDRDPAPLGGNLPVVRQGLLHRGKGGSCGDGGLGRSGARGTTSGEG